MDVKVGVIFPSRGLVFSKTADELLQNLAKVNHKIFFSHGKSIPDCFNEPLERALADKSITHIWFVEDDMVLGNTNILVGMLLEHAAVVTMDYPINQEGRGSVFEVKNRIIFCGTGCLLVKREVFDELPKPVFRTEVRWRMKNCGEFIKMTSHKVEDEGYGLHDINFSMALYRLNIPIHKLEGKLGQRKLLSLGKAGSNNGAHNIKVWTKLVRNHLLKQVKKWPIEKTGSLITVITPTGEVMLSHNHAKKLIKKGLATKTPKRPVVVDWSGFYEASSLSDNV